MIDFTSEELLGNFTQNFHNTDDITFLTILGTTPDVLLLKDHLFSACLKDAIYSFTVKDNGTYIITFYFNSIQNLSPTSIIC